MLYFFQLHDKKLFIGYYNRHGIITLKTICDRIIHTIISALYKLFNKSWAAMSSLAHNNQSQYDLSELFISMEGGGKGRAKTPVH